MGTNSEEGSISIVSSSTSSASASGKSASISAGKAEVLVQGSETKETLLADFDFLLMLETFLSDCKAAAKVEGAMLLCVWGML